MKNLKMEKKLLVAFGTLMAVILFATVMVFYSMIMGNIRVQTLFGENMAASETLSEISGAISRQGQLLREALMYGDDAQVLAETKEQLSESDAALTKSVAEYEAVTREKTDAAKAFKTLLQTEYAQYKQTILDEISKNGSRSAVYLPEDDIEQRLQSAIGELRTENRVLVGNIAKESQSKFILFFSIATPVVLFAIIWTIYLILYFRKYVTAKIEEIADAAEQISLGSTDISIRAESRDEIGRMTEAFNRMTAGIREQVSVIEALASGDFSVRSSLRSEEDTLALAINRTAEDLSRVFMEIRASAEEVDDGAKQISETASSLSGGSSEQADSLEQLAKAISDLSERIGFNAQQAGQANSMTAEAAEKVSKSNEHMQQMIAAMNEISEATARIEKIIRTIDDIAFQTNILALNASVEAARAGAAGKGFSVVAEEVRSLAIKSAEAAKETAAFIDNTKQAVERGAQTADITASALEEIVGKTRTMSELSGEIAASSEEQAGAVAQFRTGLDSIAGVVQNNSAAAQQSAAAGEQLRSQSSLLRRLLDRFSFRSSDSLSENV